MASFANPSSPHNANRIDPHAELHFSQHGSVCGCPEFWEPADSQTEDLNSTDTSSPTDLLTRELSSHCPYMAHCPVAYAGISIATPPSDAASFSWPPPPPQTALEPTAPPSRELKETCIFWYHGNCKSGAQCTHEHELNHNWPIAVPWGYNHDQRRCELKFCPLRTDLVEFMQRYYPRGSAEHDEDEGFEGEGQIKIEDPGSVVDEMSEAGDGEGDGDWEEQSWRSGSDVSDDEDQELSDAALGDAEEGEASTRPAVGYRGGERVAAASTSAPAPAPAPVRSLLSRISYTTEAESNFPRQNQANGRKEAQAKANRKATKRDLRVAQQLAFKDFAKAVVRQKTVRALNNPIDQLIAQHGSVPSPEDTSGPETVTSDGDAADHAPGEVNLKLEQVQTPRDLVADHPEGRAEAPAPSRRVKRAFGRATREEKYTALANICGCKDAEDVSSLLQNMTQADRQETYNLYSQFRQLTVEMENTFADPGATAEPDTTPREAGIVSPPAEPRTSLPPPTAINHTGTQRRKRRPSSLHDRAAVNKRAHLEMQSPAFQTRTQFVKSPAVPLAARITHTISTAPASSPAPCGPSAPLPYRHLHGSARAVISRPAPPAGPKGTYNICFFWYHQGFCRLRHGTKCGHLHQMAPGMKVSWPVNLQQHRDDCDLPLCPIVLAQKDSTMSQTEILRKFGFAIN
ncbi:hypothetical protein BU23DRAFT_564590 [Bimuria novae-zelandiae CBS 107.79]|uniref:C3H1-type domain-containing protein n=1 Tax=Bimuria novae-zelandiae CBS 107.79 TaxID=1447943 RepID=A0A6A5VS61_9PLEO|nr:hypothetical protein BU23DRAFT_564590 [Bimuria novae-zelandiae CBS 107.79]